MFVESDKRTIFSNETFSKCSKLNKKWILFKLEMYNIKLIEEKSFISE